MKYELNVITPTVTIENTEVAVVCGETRFILYRPTANEFNSRGDIIGGRLGDWLPRRDWRSHDTTRLGDRRGFALPYEEMLAWAKEVAQKEERARRILLAAQDLAEEL